MLFPGIVGASWQAPQLATFWRWTAYKLWRFSTCGNSGRSKMQV